MPKKGMKRPQRTHNQERNTAAPVPEIQGKAKSGKEKANPIITNSKEGSQKVFHSTPFSGEKPISKVYPVVDTDLAGDNIENDITAADTEDL